MTEEVQKAQVEQKPNDKEYNFRQIEKKLMEERQTAAQERAAREELEREVQRLRNAHSNSDTDEEDSEPYVDHKRLNKKLERFGQQQEKHTENKIQNAVQSALKEERKQQWISSNPDFYEVLQNHAEKLAEKAPKLADSILSMPDSFERQQLVYNNIKALGLDSQRKDASIQEKVDANRKSPYYQPSGISNAPYAPVGDFSPAGQKNAFNKMQELKNRLRI